MSTVAGDVTVVALAGGGSRRFGSDKLAATIRGTTVLDHLLSGLPEEWPVVVVGEPRTTARPVEWTIEDPAGGGPLAGVAAGLARVTTALVAVVAGDMPFAAPAVVGLVEVLRSAPPEVGGAVGTDEHDHANPLLAAYRVDVLRDAVPHPAHGRAAKTLLAVPHVEVRVTGVAARDVDTPADLDELGGGPGQLGFGAPGRA